MDSFEDESYQQLKEAAEQRRHAHYQLRLYVSGSSERSGKAITNLTTICEEHLAGRYTLEIVDLYQQPDRAREGHVLAAPTLIKELPEPVRRIVGDLSNEERVLVGLDIQVVP